MVEWACVLSLASAGCAEAARVLLWVFHNERAAQRGVSAKSLTGAGWLHFNIGWCTFSLQF